MQVSCRGFAGNSIDVNWEGLDAGNLMKMKLKGSKEVKLKGLIKFSLSRVTKLSVNKSWNISKSKLLLTNFANSIFDSDFRRQGDQQKFK